MSRLWLVSLAALFAVDASAQRYQLVEPSGRVSGTVNVQRSRLILYERSGQQAHFNREARYDSADGRLLGYFSFELNRVLRFPKSGSGPMQTADLNDAAPRFETSLRTVRPAAETIDRPFGFADDPLARGFIEPYAAGFRAAPPLPSLLIDSRTVVNPPLSPARVTFHNDGPRDVRVTLVDLKDSSGSRSLRVASGGRTAVQLERDPSANRILKYRLSTPAGETTTREVESEIMPKHRYEVIVHAWELQSIAIDRTGKSPNPIEDVNQFGRPLGRFPLPPGPQLKSGTIDVHAAARSRGNESTIAPIFPRERRSSDNPSPLEQTILELQRAAVGR